MACLAVAGPVVSVCVREGKKERGKGVIGSLFEEIFFM